MISLLSPTCLPDVLTYLPHVVSQVVSQIWFPRYWLLVWQLFRCLPPLSQMRSPSCLLDVVSEVLSPILVVVQLSSTSLPDRCGLSVGSHMWFPRCCLPVASRVSPCVVQLSAACLPRCGLKIALILKPLTIPICFPELDFQLSPHVFHSLPCCFLVVFQIFQMLFPICHLVVQCLSCKYGLFIVSESVPDVLSRFSPSCFALNPTMPSCLPDLVPQ